MGTGMRICVSEWVQFLFTFLGFDDVNFALNVLVSRWGGLSFFGGVGGEVFLFCDCEGGSKNSVREDSWGNSVFG